MIIVVVYVVDDIILTGDSNNEISKTKLFLQEHLVTTYLGQLHQFLRIEVTLEKKYVLDMNAAGSQTYPTFYESSCPFD